MIKAMSKNGHFEVVGTEIERSIDGEIVWIETDEDVYQCLAETIEVVKAAESKKDIVAKLLNLRKTLIVLAAANNDCNSIYHVYIGETFKGKGNDEQTTTWLMRKTKSELNQMRNRIEKVIAK